MLSSFSSQLRQFPMNHQYEEIFSHRTLFKKPHSTCFTCSDIYIKARFRHRRWRADVTNTLPHRGPEDQAPAMGPRSRGLCLLTTMFKFYQTALPAWLSG